MPSNGLAGLHIKLDSLVGRVAQYRLMVTSARLSLKRPYSVWRFLLDDNTNGTLVIFGPEGGAQLSGLAGTWRIAYMINRFIDALLSNSHEYKLIVFLKI